MDLGLISVRYARALLKAGIEASVSDRVYSDMLTVTEKLCQGAAAQGYHRQSDAVETAEGRLADSCGRGAPCELTRTFFGLVLKEGRERIMQFIANSFITLYRKHNNLISAKLTTATTLDSQTEAKLRRLVESKTNGTVEFKTDVKPELIGGFVLEYDTYRMDASVKSQLNTILSQLN